MKEKGMVTKRRGPTLFETWAHAITREGVILRRRCRSRICAVSLSDTIGVSPQSKGRGPRKIGILVSYRLMVVGADASPVFDSIHEDIQTGLTEGLAAESMQAMDVSDVVSAPALLKNPDHARTEATISIRSAVETIVLVKGLAGSPAPAFDLLGWNLGLAADAGLAVIYTLDAAGLSPDLILADIASFLSRAQRAHATVAGVVLAGVQAAPIADVPVVTAPVSSEDLKKLIGTDATAITPLAFKVDLAARAAKDPKTIVLPEGTEPRILKATQDLLERGVAKVVLVGEQDAVQAAAQAAGATIEGAKIISTSDPVAAKYAEELAKLRAAKGMTLEQAQQLVLQPTYFATMMVQMGDADGMVSGATHTTADTIRPALQIIKTAPGNSMVSSAFLMLMPQEALILADCAVVVSPDAEQMAQIAVTSAKTARQFGLDPKVAMLSYSTGTSGTGPTVDKVTEAVRDAKALAPDLPIEGPIQYDAAVDPEVGAQKAPGSPVAGAANVLVFPSLDAGNIAYKAIQRSAGAIAVGPILQGLNKPVNDLSRGANVEDIVNTVAITVVQAQKDA